MQSPKHLLVMGGGYIGLEFGQLFRRFGSRVTIVQSGRSCSPPRTLTSRKKSPRSSSRTGLGLVERQRDARDARMAATFDWTSSNKEIR